MRQKAKIFMIMPFEDTYFEVYEMLKRTFSDDFDFSNAEIGVLIKLCQSKPNKVIAEELKISVNTVKYHIKNMLVKSGYNNKYSLALDAVDKRIIIPKLKWYCNVESEPI